MSQKTTYLVTGASRGIGRGFISALLARPNTLVIATVRDPSSPSSTSLTKIPAATNSTLLTIKLDVASEIDAARAVKALRTEHGITRIDVVISNAGIAPPSVSLLKASGADLDDAMRTNVRGPMLLFQAVQPLLERGGEGLRGPPKLVALSAGLGSIGLIDKVPMSFGVYSITKAALNFMVRKIAFEEEGLIAFVIHPGHVDTDMGAVGAKVLGIEKAETTIEESVSGMLKVIDGATKEKTSGRFMDFKGGEVPW